MLINLQPSPAKNRIYIPAMKTTRLVPRSGCLAINININPIKINVMKVCFGLIGSDLLHK